MLKIKNLGNSFRTITSGELSTGEITAVEPWEAHMLLKDSTKKIEIVGEEEAPVQIIPNKKKKK